MKHHPLDSLLLKAPGLPKKSARGRVARASYMAETTATATRTLPAASAANNPHEPISLISTAGTGGIAALASASQFLMPASPRKRRRSGDRSATSPGADEGPAAQSPLSPKTVLTSSPTLTAAAEMEAQRKEQKRRKFEAAKGGSHETSPNPPVKALGALMGIKNKNGTSTAKDAPNSAANTVSAPLAALAPTLATPDETTNEGSSIQTSPISAASLGSLEGTNAPTLSASGGQVASPSQIGGDDESVSGQGDDGSADGGEGPSNKSFTYPGPLPSAQANDGRRNMSLPGSGLALDDSKSSPSSNKKHKCPYCSTEFTRHHNLKSHLLTHSREKPYLCQTCDSRFRRLHDLKRHTKLHTGERPHICPMCKRSFARGDALARHNKGQGGCAGRRSSAGSFGGEGSFSNGMVGNDDQMEGMIYTTGEGVQEPENMDEDADGVPDDRGSNLPSIRHHGAPASQQSGVTSQGAYQQRQPSTYPPAAPRAPMAGSLYPPGATPTHAAPSGSTSPNHQIPLHASFPASPNYSAGTAYGQQPITESPKPLSPGRPHHSYSSANPRNRSPSLTNQLSSLSYGRRTHSRNSPPPPSLPPPPAHTNAPTLPLPHGLNLNPPVPDPRYTLGSSPTSSHHPPHVGSAGGMQSSASNSLSSHGTGQAGSGDRTLLPFGMEDRVWALMRGLEAKVERLEAEVSSLRTQLQSQQQQQQQQQHQQHHQQQQHQQHQQTQQTQQTQQAQPQEQVQAPTQT